MKKTGRYDWRADRTIIFDAGSFVMNEHTKLCEYCRAAYAPVRTWQRFCSKLCGSKWFNEERKRALKRLREGS